MSRRPFVRDVFLSTSNDMRNKRLNKQDRKIGYLYIENITDKPFWQKIATEHNMMVYQNNAKFFMAGKSNILYYKNNGENETLLDKCSKELLIAIDSDFDNLCPNTNNSDWLTHQNKAFVLQTYAHGRENIVFSPDCLYAILENKFKLYLDIHNNPILDIFQELSEIWLAPYQKFLYLYNQGVYSHNDWIKEIGFQNKECQDIAIKQDFTYYKNRLNKLNDELSIKIDNQNDFDKFCNHLTQKGFLKNTVWAFIRCHDFEKQFVEPLMKEIIKDRQSKEFNSVQDNYADNEISNRRKELANYFKDINHLTTILHHYFYDVYFQTAKNSHLFLSKITQDYHKIINA